MEQDASGPPGGAGFMVRPARAGAVSPAGNLPAPVLTPLTKGRHVMHEHEFQGQKLRHDHPGDELPHGYFGHPEDIKSGTPLTDDELRLLRSYEDGPRIWDAADLLHRVWALADRGLIEMVPGNFCAYQLTEAGRGALQPDGSNPGRRGER
jgi:hypothetical protein